MSCSFRFQLHWIYYLSTWRISGDRVEIAKAYAELQPGRGICIVQDSLCSLTYDARLSSPQCVIQLCLARGAEDDQADMRRNGQRSVARGTVNGTNLPR
jgi:hypothetical protein